MACATTYPSSSVNNSAVQYIAAYAHMKTGIPRSVLLAQILWETAGATSNVWYTCHNPAGITGGSCGGECGSVPCSYAYYPTYQDAAVGYADNYLGGYYNNVLAIARAGGSYAQVCYALGQSPWAGSHYECDGVAGEILVQTIQLNGLTRFDAVPATVTVTVPSGSETATGTATGTTQKQTSSPNQPNCSAQTLATLGSYVGEGSAAAVQPGLYLFSKAANGVIINTVVNSNCQVQGTFAHAPTTTKTVTVPGATKTVTEQVPGPVQIVTRTVTAVPAWAWWTAGALALGAGTYYAYKRGWLQLPSKF